eukprot:1562072-Prymnesium_polylepis.1
MSRLPTWWCRCAAHTPTCGQGIGAAMWGGDQNDWVAHTRRIHRTRGAAYAVARGACARASLSPHSKAGLPSARPVLCAPGRRRRDRPLPEDPRSAGEGDGLRQGHLRQLSASEDGTRGGVAEHPPFGGEAAACRLVRHHAVQSAIAVNGWILLMEAGVVWSPSQNCVESYAVLLYALGEPKRPRGGERTCQTRENLPKPPKPQWRVMS